MKPSLPGFRTGAACSRQPLREGYPRPGEEKTRAMRAWASS
ncbi:MAG: hypothetical protein H6Q79_2618 [Deltaproteobacteria bacterium]|nr:hypothetical protein [Deltaproteobacteria bacterium]